MSSRTASRPLGARAAATPTGVAVGSWIGLLVSAISEYGFDVDFPLTPTLWLAIAVCAVIVATAHARFGNQVTHNGSGESSAYWSRSAPLFSGPVSFITHGNKSPRFSNRSQSIFQNQSSNLSGHHDQVNSGDAIFTVGTAILAVIFLSPATSRGPPWASEQSMHLFDGTPGHLAASSCTAPLPSEIRFPNSRLFTITTRKGDQT